MCYEDGAEAPPEENNERLEGHTDDEQEEELTRDLHDNEDDEVGDDVPVSGAAEAAGMEVEEPDASAAVPQEVPEAAEAAEEPCREARVDGAHAAPVPRGLPDCELPPHCSVYYGHPVNGSPFVQAYLPDGFKFNKKKSRAVCYREQGLNLQSSKAAKRTKEEALTCVTSWCWSWFASLTDAQKRQLSGSDGAQGGERPAKRARAA
eukprot:s4905_g5.t1